jgi:hypothetical protein
MMEVIRSFETSVPARSTRRNIPEDGILKGIYIKCSAPFQANREANKLRNIWALWCCHPFAMYYSRRSLMACLSVCIGRWVIQEQTCIGHVYRRTRHSGQHTKLSAVSLELLASYTCVRRKAKLQICLQNTSELRQDSEGSNAALTANRVHWLPLNALLEFRPTYQLEWQGFPRTLPPCRNMVLQNPERFLPNPFQSTIPPRISLLPVDRRVDRVHFGLGAVVERESSPATLVTELSRAHAGIHSTLHGYLPNQLVHKSRTTQTHTKHWAGGEEKKMQ